MGAESTDAAVRVLDFGQEGEKILAGLSSMKNGGGGIKHENNGDDQMPVDWLMSTGNWNPF